jgi:hypothetical protein
MNPSVYHPGVAEPRALKVVGRPAFHATDDDRTKVARMSRLGIPQAHVAIVFGISCKTLRKHFRKELTEAIEANLKVAKTLFQMATSGKDIAATIFWAKTRCGFRSGSSASTDFEFDETEDAN